MCAAVRLNLAQSQMQQAQLVPGSYGYVQGPTGPTGSAGVPGAVGALFSTGPLGVTGSIGILNHPLGSSFTIWPPSDTPREPLPSAGMKVEDLIGWRIWRLREDGHLWSYAIDHVWLPGYSTTGKPGDHDHAGVWAFKDRQRAIQKAADHWGTGPFVYGSVRLWGTVVEHSEGFRAENARIISIEGGSGGISEKELNRLRALYKVRGAACVDVPAVAWTGREEPVATPVFSGNRFGELPPLPERRSYFPWSLAALLSIVLLMVFATAWIAHLPTH